MLRQIAEAALEAPDETVREVIYPVVGGETTLQDLVAEYRARRHRVPTQQAAGVQGVLHQPLPAGPDQAATACWSSGPATPRTAR